MIRLGTDKLCSLTELLDRTREYNRLHPGILSRETLALLAAVFDEDYHYIVGALLHGERGEEMPSKTRADLHVSDRQSERFWTYGDIARAAIAKATGGEVTK